MSNKLKKNKFPIRVGQLGEAKQLYFCDPELNLVCHGRFKDEHCGKRCFCTTHAEFSKEPHKPITQAQYLKEAKRRIEKHEIEIDDKE